MKKTIVVLLAFALFSSTPLFAQGTGGVSKRGTTAAPFLSIAQGARAVGIGGAFVAIADDPSAMYWNPSGISDLQGFHLMVDHTYWFADIQYNYVGATIDLGSYGALGLNMTASDIGEMNVTTVDQQEGTGEVFSVNDLAVGVTYALKLTDKFAIGFNPKFIYQKIWKMSASAIALDLGVKYQTPFDGVTLGMSITNFGSKMQMTGSNALVLYDSDPGNTGHNTRIPAELATEQWDLPLNFRVGLAYDVPMGGLGKMKIAVDASHPSDNFESVDIGGEYVFDDFVYVRGGMKSLFQKDSEESFTAGLGIRQFVMGNLQLSVDYSYQDLKRLKSAQKVTLGVAF